MSGDLRSPTDPTAALLAPGGAFEIIDVDVDGVSLRTWRHAPRTLVDLLESSRGYADREFLVHEGRRMSFAEHYWQAVTMAARLRAHGVGPGDRVAIAARNLPEVVVTFWGAIAAGAVVAPLNAWWTSEELAVGLNDSEATVLILDEERLARLRKQFDGLRTLRHIVVISDDPAGEADLGKPHDVIALHGYRHFLGSTDRSLDLPPHDGDPDAQAMILYTSGTSARTKGTVVTHRNALSGVVSLAFAQACRDLREGLDRSRVRDIALVNIPLFHVTGALGALVSLTASGGTMVTMRHFDAGRALELIERERVTTIGGVPTIVQQLLAHPDLARRDLSSVRWVAYGGAPAPADLAAKVHAAWPRAVVSNGYGLTVTSAIVTHISGRDYLDHPASSGVVVPVCDLAIVPETFDGAEPSPDNLCAPDEVGEIWVRGPNVVRGYWRKPQATAQAFSRGWVRTGDVGRLDADGRLYVLERSKDMIVHQGRTIYPSAVEAEILAHPGVADCAVVGLSRDGDEEVVAVVVPREEGVIDERALEDFVASRLRDEERPTRFVLRAFALPRNAQLKVLRRQLRESLESES